MFNVEFVAMMAHTGKPAELEDLAAELQSGEFKEVRKLIDSTLESRPNGRQWLGTGRWEWTDDPVEAARRDWPKGIAVTLEGPGGFVFDFFARAWSLYHVTPWRSFIDEETSCNALRRVSFELSARFGKPRAIYVPDSTWNASDATEPLANSQSLTGVEHWLLENVGPPSASIPAIGKEVDGEWEGDGYFIDDFHDFLQRSD